MFKQKIQVNFSCDNGHKNAIISFFVNYFQNLFLAIENKVFEGNRKKF